MPRKKVKKARSSAPTLRQLISLPNQADELSELADWVEVSAWIQSDYQVSREEVLSVFSFASDSNDAEEKVSKLWDELKTRAVILQDHYPFALSPGEEIFQFKNNDRYKAYLFCLLLSFVGLTKINSRTFPAASIFEELCSSVAQKYISSESVPAKSLHFGWPRNSWPRRQRSLLKALPELIRTLGDGENLIDGVRSGRSAHTGDAGLDIAAWRPFVDERRGMLVFLGQCATSRDHNSYMKKLGDLDSFLLECVNFNFPNTLGLFIPHILSDNDQSHKEYWERIKRRKNIPFDRIRIALYGESWSNSKLDTFLSSQRKKLKQEHSLT
ncbi:MAG: hypothetical protein UW46_C0005G0050 [Candidatus Yanofskybacteria bacterium GW2011_GWF1_44_227]|uniref:Uncharacterized protein n=1 Tax=Candidatus Yanofskybacteria bacterium GW2011_GWE2_40_11 TaxID=1619033 RepID=A0A0G0QLK1_9BACT|nr:MAG: hypothetical protein UT69_C0018G0011 [Candidatus Yanofskybacteria bacterium GW2011_GWE1_40_10]KKR41013.1 MAG: hypothetical protein UT75_C0002G0050 [Candidatus Yanofskybacteria bacterium GW2011_GWE2_40_11]KKT53244.1 MAG: hypothetical protein UW46_C0005G0050 [Candidatus Yanofskybacteria bacterium GW2011_GWF1_44_227]OGN35548.1 MAG: hypothetical protein A2207_02290 [Candidatus Yanofskybacteria bacterium RIFOXYA1_FULL_44_17]OGN36747.1 MAG: hypothetical protein A2241_03090 [Candidatus Yanofsk